MPGLNLHQYWRRPVATCTGVPKAIPFERLDPPVPVANSGTISLFCFIVSHLVCTSVARSTPESHLGPHGLQNRSPPRRESRANAIQLPLYPAPSPSSASAPSLRVDPAVSSSTTANASGASSQLTFLAPATSNLNLNCSVGMFCTRAATL